MSTLHAYEPADLWTTRPSVVFRVTDRLATRRALDVPSGPAGRVAFSMVAAGAPGQVDVLSPAWLLRTVRCSATVFAFFGEARPTVGGNDWFTLDNWPDVAVIEVVAPLYRSAPRVTVRMDPAQQAAPPSVVNISLEPGDRYPFPAGSAVTLGRGPTLIRGTVLDRVGTPVADAVVDLDGADESLDGVERRLARYTTGVSGSFVFVMPDEDQTVTVRASSEMLGPAPVELGRVDTRAGWTATLRATGLHGLVRAGWSRRPVGGAVVTASRLGPAVSTSGDGTWRLIVLPAVTAAIRTDVEVTHPDGRSLSRSVVVRPTENVSVPTFDFN